VCAVAVAEMAGLFDETSEFDDGNYADVIANYCVQCIHVLSSSAIAERPCEA